MIELYSTENTSKRLIGAGLSIETVLNYVSVFIIFTGGWSYNALNFAELRLSYFIIAFVLLSWLPFLKSIYFHKFFLFLFFIISISSLYNISVGNNTLDLFIKQFIGIFSHSLFFYLLLKINDYNIKYLFKIYLNIAFIVALIGMLQEVSYLVGVRPGYDFKNLIPTWSLIINPTLSLPRLNSILPEPSHFCDVMMPAFFVSVTSFLKNNFRFQKKWKSLIIISSFFFTFSSVGYIGIFLSLILLACSYRKVRYLIIGTLIVCALISFCYKNFNDFKMRVDHAIKVLYGHMELEKADSSTFALYSNALVAYRCFLDNPLFGAGLGSHQLSYYKYIARVINVDMMNYGGFLNVKDASSLFLRLSSETGLLGLLIISVFIVKFYTVRKEGKSNYLWIINNAVLSMFFIKLLRIGHYFIDGSLFFFWLYYFSKIKLDETKAKKVL